MTRGNMSARRDIHHIPSRMGRLRQRHWAMEQYGDMFFRYFFKLQGDQTLIKGGWSQPMEAIGLRLSPGIISEKELCELFCWRPESEYSTGPVIYLVGHGLQVANVPGDIGAFREVLPDNSVGILIRSPLPRRVRVGGIHRDIGCDGEGGVLGHLGALVPGDRSAQVRGHVPDGLDDALADRFGVAAVRQRNRDKVPALALHQGSHRGFPRLADHEVTFPVARYFTALGLLRALRYRDHPDDPGTLGAGPAPRLAARPAAAQRDVHRRQLALR